MRSSQPASQEQASSAMNAPAGNDALQQVAEGSPDSIKVASDQETPASEDTVAGASGSDAVPGSDAALANQGTPATEDGHPNQTLDQHQEGEAKRGASAATDTLQASMQEIDTAAPESESSEESASQAPSEPLPIAEDEDLKSGSEAALALDTGMKDTTESQQQSASEAAHSTTADVSRHLTPDSHDPQDPYSMAFKVQPWPKTVRW